MVGGLTALVNVVMRKDDEVEDIDEEREPLTVSELHDGIERLDASVPRRCELDGCVLFKIIPLIPQSGL